MSNPVKQMGPITKSWLDKCFLSNSAYTMLGISWETDYNWRTGPKVNIAVDSLMIALWLFVFPAGEFSFIFFGKSFFCRAWIRCKRHCPIIEDSLSPFPFPHTSSLNAHSISLSNPLQLTVSLAPPTGLADLQFRFSEYLILPFIFLCSPVFVSFPSKINDSQAEPPCAILYLIDQLTNVI